MFACVHFARINHGTGHFSTGPIRSPFLVVVRLCWYAVAAATAAGRGAGSGSCSCAHCNLTAHNMGCIYDHVQSTGDNRAKYNRRNTTEPWSHDCAWT